MCDNRFEVRVLKRFFFFKTWFRRDYVIRDPILIDPVGKNIRKRSIRGRFKRV